MVSNYRLNAEQHKASLHQWVDEAIRGKLWEKFVDLHIDVLDNQFKKPGCWVEASLFLLGCLADIVDDSQYDILLAIPLEAELPFQKVELRLAALEQYIGMTPPSFYLFPIHSPTLKETLFSSFYLPALSVESKWQVYFKEGGYDEEYYSNLFVTLYRPRA